MSKFNFGLGQYSLCLPEDEGRKKNTQREVYFLPTRTLGCEREMNAEQ